MKLCSICDKKITGKWCKNCHRFVKSYELSDRIYLNESHNPSSDAGCTYHTVPEQPMERYGQKSEAAGRTVSGTDGNRIGKNATGKSTGKKIAVAVGVFYAVVAVIGVIGNVASKATHEFEEEIQADLPGDGYDDVFSGAEQNEIEPELDEFWLGVMEKMDALDQIEPVDLLGDEECVVQYYDPEQIRTLGVSCCEEHFSLTLPQFDMWLKENWTDAYEVEDEESPYFNYVYSDEEYIWITFASYRDYYVDADFAVRADYDTATEQLHMIGFVSTTEKEVSELCYLTLRELDPDTDLTEDEFRANVEKALEAEEEYVIFYQSDAVEADCEVKEGMYSIYFYPAYTE